MAYINGNKILNVNVTMGSGDYKEGYDNGYNSGYESGYDEGFDEGYDEGYEDGEPNIDIDEDYLNKVEVSGTGYVVAENVLGISHPLSVKLTSDTITDFSGITISRSGRNLVKHPYTDSIKLENNMLLEDSYSIKGYAHFEGTSSADGTKYIFDENKTLKKGTYTLSIYFEGSITAGTITFIVRDAANLVNIATLKVSASTPSFPASTTFTIEEDVENVRIYALMNTGVAVNGDFAPQLEYGTEASPFELFDGYTTHPVSADGTVDGLMSICPTTVLCADDNTVNISMSYYKNEGNGEETDDRYDEGYEDGKKSVYDNFWDNYQEYGKRESHWYAFAGRGWNDNNFKPKYPMKPTNAQAMFEASLMEQPLSEDIVDFSKSTNFYTTFRDSKFKELGVIDASANSGAFSYTFANMSNCEKIREIILPDMENNTVNKFNDSTFQKMNNLTYIRFTGVIANMGANFGHSKNLDKDSIINIVSSHSNTSMTATFSKVAVNKAFETEEGKADGSSSDEWNNLIATRPNVKFTLA